VVEATLRPQPARVTIHTSNGAQVAIDGRPVGDTPLPPQELPAGKHVVTITARGREPLVRELEVARGDTRTLDAHLRMTGRRRAVPFLLYASAGLVVGTGVAITFAEIANSRMESLERERLTTGLTLSQYNSYRGDVQQRDDARDVAWAVGGAAVATAAVAAALYWFDVPRPTERTLVVPTAAGAPGVTVLGRF
jgi:hypothetical protein